MILDYQKLMHTSKSPLAKRFPGTKPLFILVGKVPLFVVLLDGERRKNCVMK